MERSLVNLTELVSQMTSDYQAVYPMHTITVTSEPGLPDFIWADRARVRQMFDNLVSNSVKASPKGSHIAVSAGPTPDGSWKFTVRDNGHGIPEEEVAHLTERFYRSTASVAAGAAGSGLGLAVVRSLIDAHKGTLAIQSTLGKGTSITVTLPVDLRKEDSSPKLGGRRLGDSTISDH
jgi:signal transduction histidine kinase